MISNYTYVYRFTVAWLGNEQKLTCEPASSLPPDIIDEHEGYVSNNYVQEKSDEQYNVITHMLIKRKYAGAPPPKRK